MHPAHKPSAPLHTNPLRILFLTYPGFIQVPTVVSESSFLPKCSLRLHSLRRARDFSVEDLVERLFYDTPETRHDQLPLPELSFCRALFHSYQKVLLDIWSYTIVGVKGASSSRLPSSPLGLSHASDNMLLLHCVILIILPVHCPIHVDNARDRANTSVTRS